MQMKMKHIAQGLDEAGVPLIKRASVKYGVPAREILVGLGAAAWSAGRKT